MQCMQKIKKGNLGVVLNIIHVCIVINISHSKTKRCTHVEIIYLHTVCHKLDVLLVWYILPLCCLCITTNQIFVIVFATYCYIILIPEPL